MSTDKPDEIDGEVLSSQLTKAEQLPMGMQLLKMENESIMSLARVAPRDATKVIAELKTFLHAYPAAATEAVYAKPVGKIFSITCKDCNIVYEDPSDMANVECPVCGSARKTNIQKRQKYAEGLSIRAAESIRSAYGYTRLAVEMEELPDGKVRIAGTLVDYAAGNMTSDERIVSPFYKSRQGGIQRTPEDRFLNVVVKAEKAKLRRDLILDSIPGIVKAFYRDECDKMADEVVPDEFVTQKIIPGFAKFGMSKAHLEEIVGQKASMGWTKEQSRELSNILAGLKSGDYTVAEVLRELVPQSPTGESNPTKAATGDVLKDIAAKRAAERAAKTGDSLPAGLNAQQADRFVQSLQLPRSADEHADNWRLAQKFMLETPLTDETKARIEQAYKIGSERLNAPETHQNATDAKQAPEVDQTAETAPATPYEGEELVQVVAAFRKKIERSMTDKALKAVAAQMHADDRLPGESFLELLDAASDQEEKIGG